MNKLETLKKIVEALKEQNQIDEDFADAIRKVNLLEESFYYNNGALIDTLMEIGEELLPNNPDKDWFGWWVYDNNFGKNGLYIKREDKTYEIKTIESLYNCLLELELLEKTQKHEQACFK